MIFKKGEFYLFSNRIGSSCPDRIIECVDDLDSKEIEGMYTSYFTGTYSSFRECLESFGLNELFFTSPTCNDCYAGKYGPTCFHIFAAVCQRMFPDRHLIKQSSNP